jgi:hypothetical protein
MFHAVILKAVVLQQIGNVLDFETPNPAGTGVCWLFCVYFPRLYVHLITVYSCILSM